MDNELSEKKNKFKSEIRRKFIDDLFKQTRQQLLQRQKQSEAPKDMKPPSLDSLMSCIESASVAGLYNSIHMFGNFIKAVPLDLYDPIIALIMTPNSLATNQGLLLLSLAIHNCCCLNDNSPIRQSMIQILERYGVVEKIYSLALYTVNNKEDLKRTRVVLNCLKSLALGRIEKVRDPQMLQQYLSLLIKEAIQEPSILILMSYVSQKTTFAPETISAVCRLSFMKEQIFKITTCHILMNYCLLQQNMLNIGAIFMDVGMALQHLYISMNELKAKFSFKILHCLYQLISKYPENSERQLLISLHRCKIQELFAVLLQVSTDQIHIMVFEIQALIIGKTIGPLRQEFFALFPKQMLITVILGIESSNLQIITKSLQVLTKITHFAPSEYLSKIQRQHELSFVTQNLSYHHNDYISGVAECLCQSFKAIRQQQEGQHQMTQ